MRRDFPILQQRVNGGKPLVWLDNAATTHKPLAVIQRISKYYETENSNIHRAAHELPNEPDEAALRAFADTIRVRNGVVLIFDQPSPDQIDAQALMRVPGIQQVARVADGAVFAAR